MQYSIFNVPKPVNEPILDYAPGSKEKLGVKKELEKQASKVIKIPAVINGKEIWDGEIVKITMPHDHSHVLAEYIKIGKKELEEAASAALEAKKKWENMPWEHRAGIFLKAADLIAGPYRHKLNAATMLGQSKTIFQAEIDSACEIADFLRFNVYFAQEIYKNQPESAPGEWNKLEHRPLSGFILAISPFNFTAIGGNLPSAPAIMGNTVVWKPAGTAVLSNYYLYEVFKEAGLPDGVINFVPSNGSDVSETIMKHPKLAGVHFTGSTAVFSNMWKTIGENINIYEAYPRLVGETGGKDFVFAHKTANVKGVVVALVRGAFEYQGQKCSAASRAYIPRSLWEGVKKGLLDEIAKIKVGDVRDFTNFMGAVIDKASFDNIVSYIKDAKSSSGAELIMGSYDDSKGYFVYPTVIEAKTIDYKSMREEIFGPVLTIYVYEDEKLEETLEACKTGSAYALTGAILSQDRYALSYMKDCLADAAGNFYLNDKPTGAVVGRQPFGGGRASGTNDKAGSILNLLRWVNPRTVKETFVTPENVEYPFMQEV